MFKKTINKKHILKFLIFLLPAIFLILTTKFFDNTSEFHTSATFGLLNQNTISVGTNATLRPFEYLDEKTNEIVGFDIDFVKQIAKNLNINIEIKDMDFDALIPSIGSKIDIAIAAITKNPEREEVISFSKPYYHTKQFVLTKINTKIENKNQLAKLKLATQIGTSAQELVQDLLKNTDKNQFKPYKEYITMVDDLKKGSIDAIVLDSDTAKIYQKMNSNELKTIDGTLFGWEEEHYCIACPKQNSALLNAINEQIDVLTKSPFFDDLVKKYITGDSKLVVRT